MKPNLIRHHTARFAPTAASFAAVAVLIPAPTRAQLFPASISTADLDGTIGYTIATRTNDNPYALSASGDFNGDGLDDVLLGASESTNFGNFPASYLVQGSATPAAQTSVTSLNGANGFAMIGPTNTAFGRSLSQGDFNGDGLSDLLLGAPNAPSNNSAFVVFGSSSAQPNPFAVTNVNGANGFRLTQPQALGKSYAGFSVASGFDMNGDGFDEIAIGDPFDSLARGSIYLRFGQSGPQPASQSMGNPNGTNSVIIQGSGLYSLAGFSLSSAGDINGDGYEDLFTRSAISAPFLAPSYGHVIFGRGQPFPPVVSLAALTGENGFTITSNQTNKGYSGFAVAAGAAGDFNGDGIDDLAFPFVQPSLTVGGIAIINGRSSFPYSVNFDSLSGDDGTRILGTTNLPLTFTSLSSGDINGDGQDDLVVGAPLGTNGSFVLFGGQPFPTTVTAATFTGNNGFRITSPDPTPGLGIGTSVGDVNGDGLDDITLSNPVVDPGFAHVIFGRSTGSLQLVGLSPADDSTNVATSSNLELSFNRNMTAVSGDLVIRSDDGTVLETIPVSDASRIQVRGQSVVFNPTNTLPPATAVNVQLAAGALQAGANGATFGGIVGPTNWNFTTAETRIETATVVYAMPNPSQQGETVELSATVVAFSGTPTGTVEFFDGATSLGSAPLTAGLAQLDVASLPAGTRTITARYSGSSTHAPSEGTLSGGQVVQPSATTGGSSTAGGATAGGTGGGSTSAGGTGAGGTGGSGLLVLDWVVTLKKPKEGKEVKFKADKKGIGTIKGSIDETGLDKGFEDIEVQIAVIASTGSSNSNAAPDWQEATVKKVNKKGSAKFSAKKFGADLDLESGDSFRLLVRASTNFGSATTETNDTEFEVK